MDFYSAANVPAQVGSLPETNGGIDAVRETLRTMVAIVRKYKSDAGTINVARQVLRAAGITDGRSQRVQSVRALQHFVRDRIVYLSDPRGIELLQTPPQTLSIGTGDCDDKSILIATLLETVGFDTRFLAVGGTGREWANGGDDWDAMGNPPYSHVLTQVQIPEAPYSKLWGGRWLCLETIVPGADAGWCPKGIEVFMVAHV